MIREIFLAKNRLSLFVLFIFFPFVLLFSKEESLSNAPKETLLNSIANNSETSDAYQENLINNEIRQPFSWQSAGDVSAYDVIIERTTNRVGRYETVYSHTTNREETKNCLLYIEPPLPPGNYRSTIKVYNVLGILEEQLTVFNEFEIKAALKPVILSVSYPMNFNNTIYLDDLDNNGIIEISGANLMMPRSENNNDSYTRYELKNKDLTLSPVSVISHDDRNTRIALKFDISNIKRGSYHIVAYDVSGLHSNETITSLINVEFKKRFDVELSLLYSMSVLTNDQSFVDYVQNRFLPLGLTAKLTYIPVKGTYGYFGLGLAGNYTRLFSLKPIDSSYTITGDLVYANFNLIFQVPLLRRHILLDFHSGVGLFRLDNLTLHFIASEYDSDSSSDWGPTFDAGISTQFYFNKKVFLELSLDYTLCFASEGLKMGFFTPSIGVGYQF